MKFLLVAVNAKYIHSNPAVYSLKAYSGELSPHVDIREYTINHQKDQVLAGIYEANPDVVGFSCYIWNIEFVKSIIRDLKKILPEVPVWVGGPEVSYDGEKLLKAMPEITGVMQGEGEEIFKNVLSYYVEEKGQMEDIPGILWRKGEKITQNVEQEPILLDEVPFLYENMEPFNNRIVYYESSRGCPFSCSYCLSSIDKKVRFRNLDIVKKELQYFLDRKIPQVKFVDRTFNCRKSHSMGIWQYLLDHDNGVTNFHFEISADLISEEELAILEKMRPGLIQLEIGVQTTNEKTLEAIHRGASFEKIAEITGKIRSFDNVHQHLDLIAGLPYEDLERFGQSFDEVYHLKPDQLQLGFLKVLKGSEMAERAEEYGICYRSEAPYEVLSTQWISYENLLELKSIEEMVEVYYNSGMFSHSVKELVRYFQRPFLFYQKLARYYKEKGLFDGKHTRQARYEILYRFAREQVPEILPCVEALLRMDYYVRENARTPLSFAPALKKERTNEFYRKEAEERKFLKNYEGFNGKQMMNMTHLEFFDFDVLRYEETGEYVKGDFACLYDYKEHNSFRKDARVIWLMKNGEDYDSYSH